MGLDEATDAKLPFGMGTIDLGNPVSALVAFVGLCLGAIVWSMASSIGDNYAGSLASFLGNIIGTNPATGEDTGNQAPIGGS